jgi:alpha-1,2-mannosyltransferase
VTAAPPTAAPPRAPLLPVACVALFAAVALVFGPRFVSLFAPHGSYTDFVQEWLSARNYWAGDPVYLPQREALLRRTGVDLTEFDRELPWNAHPPVAVLVALPFGLVADYDAAHLAWNLVTFPLLPLALLLVARELNLRVPWWGALAGAALLIGWNAVQYQLYHGQLNCLMALLLVLAWVADRRGAEGAAGALAGAAAAAKLFPGLLLVYFVAARKWRAAGALVAVAAALNLVALAAFGFAAFETYARDVVPSLGVFRRAWLNVSLTGYFTRLGDALGAPRAGPAVALCAQALTVLAVWVAARRARDARARDRAFALAAVGMVLASPVAWTHYFVLVSFPLLVAWARPPRGAALGALALASAALWLPERLVPNLFAGPGEVVPTNDAQPVPRPLMAALGLGPFTFALVALFVVLFARSEPGGRA